MSYQVCWVFLYNSNSQANGFIVICLWLKDRVCSVFWSSPYASGWVSNNGTMNYCGSLMPGNSGAIVRNFSACSHFPQWVHSFIRNVLSPACFQRYRQYHSFCPERSVNRSMSLVTQGITFSFTAKNTRSARLTTLSLIGFTTPRLFRLFIPLAG